MLSPTKCHSTRRFGAQPSWKLSFAEKPELLQDQHAYKVVGGTADGTLVGAIRECGVWQGRIA